MEPKKKNRNRQAGHKWECQVAKDLREHGYPHAVTARSSNRARDAEKVDIVNSNEFVNGRMMDDVQAKSTGSIPWQLLLELEKLDKGKPKRRKILAVKLGQMSDTTSGKRRKVHQMKLAVMPWSNYLQMLAIVKTVEAYMGTTDASAHPAIINKLVELTSNAKRANHV